MKLHLLGRNIARVQVHFYREQVEKGVPLLVAYCYRNATITAIRPFDHGSPGDPLLEEVTFTARQFVESYYDQSGRLVSQEGWDSATGREQTRC